MKIKNTTRWDTDDLRKIFTECQRRVNKIESPTVRGARNVEVKNTRDTSMRGRATIGGSIWKDGGWMMIKIPRVWQFKSSKEKEKLAQVFTHEYYHNLGVRSIDRRHYKNDFTRDFDYSWVKEYVVNEAKVVVKLKTDIQLVRYERIMTNLKKASTRLKRAKTIQQKWSKKKKYYENVLVASGKIRKD